MAKRNKNLVCLAKMHGTHHAYRRFNCRCPETFEFMARYQAERRERAEKNGAAVVDATATHRMIRALIAAGWTSEELSIRLGYQRRETVRGWLDCERVLRTTQGKVQALYDALQHVPGPSRLNQMRSRHKGWAPPLAWDDITDPEATPIGMRVSDKRKYIRASELMYEYQIIRDSGIDHEFALRELGVTQSGWEAARDTARKQKTA